MAKIPFYNSEGKELSAKEVSDNVFSAKIIKSILHQVVRLHLAKKRAGTHKTLTRAQVRGGGKKPWKQKGTGRARAGSNTSPIWVGGGTAHGPKNRSYDFNLNKKQKKAALCGALSARLQEGKCKGLESFSLDEIKTKQALKVLNNLGITNGEKVLVVSSAEDSNVDRSVRNIKGVKNVSVDGLNVYDILNAKHLVLTDKAISGIEAKLN